MVKQVHVEIVKYVIMKELFALLNVFITNYVCKCNCGNRAYDEHFIFLSNNLSKLRLAFLTFNATIIKICTLL